jgi:hypothetical protein
LVAAAVALLAVGCSGAKKAAQASTATSSTASTTTSTTVPPPPPIAPLTGLPQPNAADLSRVAIVVKIDNVDQARPQAGLDDADLVFEELVEGQLTRLIAIFQSTDSARIGPVRSTRTTDIDIVEALNHPLYSYSGGNANYVAQLRASTVVDVGADTYASPYFYSGPHIAPHDLYTSTAGLLTLAPAGSGPPPPFFVYRGTGQPVTAAGAAPATHVDLSFGQAAAAWDWDATSQTWKRSQNGTADVLQDGQQIEAANVIVQFIPYVTDGFATGEGVNPPPPIPKGETIGSGTALIFTDGMLVHASWSKASPTAVTQYTDSNGRPIQLTPGRTWVELAPMGTSPNIS